jgi:alkylhydroperoxidase/carboxymuconolactone decarboxylase family protein YurZ
MSHGPRLSAETERLVRLTIHICRGDWHGLRMLRREAPEGEPNRAWREALLQSHLFAGIPRMVEACAVLLAEGGLGSVTADEIEDQAQASPLGQPERGQALFDSIYEDTGPAVVEALEKAHPEILNVTLSHAYGRILSRPGLDGATRELLAVGALAAGNQRRQLASHTRGAQRLGAKPEAILAAAELGVSGLPEAEAETLMATAKKYSGA